MGDQRDWGHVTGVQGFSGLVFSGPFEEHTNPGLRSSTAAQRRPSGLVIFFLSPWHFLLLGVSHLGPHYSLNEENK